MIGYSSAEQSDRALNEGNKSHLTLEIYGYLIILLLAKWGSTTSH